MKELAFDLAIVVGPASVVYYLISDPWISALWIIVGVSIRWYQHRWQERPYRNGDANGAQGDKASRSDDARQ
jgi:hypothetical protein